MNVILLVISGIFLIVASVLVTYTVMNYINFKNDLEVKDNNRDDVDVVKEPNKEPLSNEEMEEFKGNFNSQILGNFLSSVSFFTIDGILVSNANAIMYVYPEFVSSEMGEDGFYRISKDDFRSEFYNLVGKELTDAEIEISSIWDAEEQIIKFKSEDRTMKTTIKIDSSYRMENKYYFVITIDNSVYGAMEREVALERLQANHYKFEYVKSTL